MAVVSLVVLTWSLWFAHKQGMLPQSVHSHVVNVSTIHVGTAILIACVHQGVLQYPFHAIPTSGFRENRPILEQLTALASHDLRASQSQCLVIVQDRRWCQLCSTLGCGALPFRYHYHQTMLCADVSRTMARQVQSSNSLPVQYATHVAMLCQYMAHRYETCGGRTGTHVTGG